MRDISILITNDGKMKSNYDRIPIGNELEHNVTRLVFNLEDKINGSFFYLILKHPEISYLYKINNNEILITRDISKYKGIWKMSFVVTNSKVIDSNFEEDNMVFSTSITEGIVFEGIINQQLEIPSLELLKDFVQCSFTEIKIPYNVTFVGEYFLTRYPFPFKLVIHSNVVEIKDYAFYLANVVDLVFEENSNLTRLGDNAFYRIPILEEITIPRSVASWGKYVLSNSSISKINFEENSNLKVISTYAFWDMSNLEELILPDGLEQIAGLSACIKACNNLKVIKIPSSMKYTIEARSIQDCPALTNIVLGEDFNVSANFINVPTLSKEAMIAMFNSLKDLTGLPSKTLTLGSVNLEKLTVDEMNIAVNKNWTLGG